MYGHNDVVIRSLTMFFDSGNPSTTFHQKKRERVREKKRVCSSVLHSFLLFMDAIVCRLLSVLFFFLSPEAFLMIILPVCNYW